MVSPQSELIAVLLGCGVVLTLSSCSSNTASNSAISESDYRFGGGVALIGNEELAALTPGITADRVLQLLGHPERVKPMNAADVRAEVWVYRVSRREAVSQIEIGAREMPSIGSSVPIATAPQPIYRNETTRVYQTIELLMINGRLEVQKPGRPEVEITYL